MRNRRPVTGRYDKEITPAMGYHQDTRKHRIIRGLVRFPSASGYRFSGYPVVGWKFFFIYRTGLSYKSHYLYDRLRWICGPGLYGKQYWLSTQTDTTREIEEAIQKFEHVTSKYNQKLLEQNDLLEVLHSLTYPGKKYRTRFLISGNEKLITLQVEDIAYFYSLNKITFAVTRQNKEYIIDFPLDKLMEQLDPDKFFRTNRQTIINIESIVKIEPYFQNKVIVHIKPEHKEKILVSKEKWASFKLWLNY